MRLGAAAVIIACLILGGFVLSVPRARDGVKLPGAEAPAMPTPPVTLRDVYKKGTHTISGSLMAPNACMTLNASVQLTGEEPSPQGILVAITLTPNDGVCLQLPTKLAFTTTLAAPADLPLTATVNGAQATTTTL